MQLDQHDRGRIRDAIYYGGRVVAMSEGKSREDFMTDETTLFAVCYGIQVVGEALWKLSDSVKSTYSAIPWPLITSMRHRLVHDYGRTDENIVYDVATVHLPELLEKLTDILATST